MPKPLLPLTFDYVFKRFFTERPELLTDFLNALFQEIGLSPITSLTINNSELFRDSADEKAGLLDIHAVDESNRAFNVEMQANYKSEFIHRTIFYAFKIFVLRRRKGESHEKAHPVYSVNILDDEINLSNHFHNRFLLLNMNHSPWPLAKNIELHFIELPKVPAAIHELKTPLLRWSGFIRSAHAYTEEEMHQLIRKNPIFKKARAFLWEISQDPYAQLEYERRELDEHLNKVELHDALEIAGIEGAARGKTEGTHNTHLEVITRMKEAGLEPGFMSRLTGLSREEVDYFLRQIRNSSQ